MIKRRKINTKDRTILEAAFAMDKLIKPWRPPLEEQEKYVLDAMDFQGVVDFVARGRGKVADPGKDKTWDAHLMSPTALKIAVSPREAVMLNHLDMVAVMPMWIRVWCNNAYAEQTRTQLFQYPFFEKELDYRRRDGYPDTLRFSVFAGEPQNGLAVPYALDSSWDDAINQLELD